jgi:hypothetical protein
MGPGRSIVNLCFNQPRRGRSILARRSESVTKPNVESPDSSGLESFGIHVSQNTRDPSTLLRAGYGHQQLGGALRPDAPGPIHLGRLDGRMRPSPYELLRGPLLHSATQPRAIILR